MSAQLRSRTTLVGGSAARLGLAFVLAVLGLVGVAGPASAHHPEITASMDCNGTVTFTATAWSTSNPAARTNSDIRVHRSLNGGSSTYSQLIKQDAFTSSNGYTFSGSFATPGNATVYLRVKAFAAWGNGAAAGDARYVSVAPPTDCNPPVDVCPTMPGDQPPGTDCNPPVDVCPTMPGNQPVGTNCNPPVAPAPPAAPTTPVVPVDTDVLGEASGKAVGSLRVSCQGTVRVTMNNRSSQRATYIVKVAKRKHDIRVGADKTRRFVTTAKARQRAQLWQGGRLLASKRLPAACVAPEVLPATGR